MLRKLVFASLATLLLAVAALALAIWQLERWGNAPLTVAGTDTIVLAPGESVAALATRLQRRDMIKSARAMRWYLRWRNLDTRLQAGAYAVDQQTTPADLLADMVAGRQIQYQVQLLEGSTVADVLDVLRGAPWLEQTLGARDAVTLHTELGLATRFAEGMFFPDTYAYIRGTTDRSVLERAHAQMLARAQQVWEGRAQGLLLEDLEDLVTLASIIEKESGQADDRARISQVFHRRLAEGMLLQTDPTVIYGLGETFDGNLTRAHLNTDHPFNTYRRRGLPPSAIALPSAASLQAAAHPASGDFLYFVARGDGSSQFSRTLSEHNAAVRKYQLGKSSE